MCKIAVYERSEGGEEFARMVERELPVIEVVRIRREEHGEKRLRRQVERSVKDYIGKVEVIVLASYEATVVALKYLRIKYPEQKFVGMSWPLLKREEGRVLVMTTNKVKGSWAFWKARRQWTGRTVKVWSCDELLTEIKKEIVNEQKIKYMIGRSGQTRPKNVVLGCVDLVMAREEIEKIYAGARVIDGYVATLKKLCRVLEIKDPMRMRRC